MFILHNPKSDAPTYIYIKKQLVDGTVRASLSMKIHPAYWDAKTKRAILAGLDRYTLEENKSINSVLSDLDKFVEARKRDARYNGSHLTCAELTAKISSLTGRALSKGKSAPNFESHCLQIMDDMKTGVLLTPRTNKRYSEGTIRGYGVSLRKILNYKPDITFEEITPAFSKEFTKWCNDKEYSLNFIAHTLKNIIQFVDEAKERGIHTNTSYRDIVLIKEDTDDITIEPEEMERIASKEIVIPGWDIARDWFVIGAHLGLRVSDVNLLNERVNFDKDYVTIANEKTDVKVVIPVNSMVKKIMKKWKGLPPKMSDAKINKYIKHVGELCKIDDTVLYFLTKGGERKDYYLKKFEMLSCHTMRRYFITTLLESGAKDHEVMQLAGIKKHSTLLRYKKTKPEKNAKIMKDHSFFK